MLSYAELGNSMGRVFLESPAVHQLIKKFPVCYQTLQFIAVFTRAHCLVVFAGGPGLKIVYPGQGFSWLSSDPSDKWPLLARPFQRINPLNPELNPICYLLALLAQHFLHVSRIRVKSLTLRLLMSYIYGAPILDVSRSHTTTQHSR